MNKEIALKEIENQAKVCTKCPLSKTRNNVVFGMGSADAEIMFVGEAPGYNEDKTGVPFCGKAGEILNQLLSSVGLSREEIYITNIIKCRPPNNRDPLPQEAESCREYLEKQLEIISPEVICCLGRHALRYIFERFSFQVNEPISKIHGQVFVNRDIFNNVKVIPLFHPAVAVYNPWKINVLKKDFSILKDFR
jgi:uracil-DNA glycosylase